MRKADARVGTCKRVRSRGYVLALYPIIGLVNGTVETWGRKWSRMKQCLYLARCMSRLVSNHEGAVFDSFCRRDGPFGRVRGTCGGCGGGCDR